MALVGGWALASQREVSSARDSPVWHPVATQHRYGVLPSPPHITMMNYSLDHHSTRHHSLQDDCALASLIPPLAFPYFQSIPDWHHEVTECPCFRSHSLATFQIVCDGATLTTHRYMVIAEYIEGIRGRHLHPISSVINFQLSPTHVASQAAD